MSEFMVDQNHLMTLNLDTPGSAAVNTLPGDLPQTQQL